MVIVDAANVVGSRPDGWWRDRAGAAARLVAALGAAVGEGAVPSPAVVVLEGAARDGAAEGNSGGLRVVHAPADGDEALLGLAAAAARSGAAVTVVTADRALAAGARLAGAGVVGPRWLLDRLGR